MGRRSLRLSDGFNSVSGTLQRRPDRVRTLQHRKATSRHRSHVQRAAGEEDASQRFAGNADLSSIIRRKREQVASSLKEFTEEELYDRLGGSELGELSEQGSEYRFAGLIPQVKFREGRPVLVLELSKPSPAATSSELADRARQFEAAGADALVVPTDAADTSTGLADLLSVCRAVRCPVLRRDWILHPLQIREAKEAGAAGVMGIVTSVVGKNAFILSSYAASLGLDCPVEVVNAEELSLAENLGIPFLGCNLGVGLSLAIPGFRSDIAAGLLGKLASWTSSMVGVTSMKEARQAKEAGADAIFVKKEWIEGAVRSGNDSASPWSDRLKKQGSAEASGKMPPGSRESSSELVLDRLVAAFVQEIKYATGGDD